jgi:hypothetical protein
VSEPEAGRPIIPEGYGVTTSLEGMLPWSWVEEALTRSRNYWIVTAGGSGWPHAAPVWGVWSDGALYFSTGRDSRKARNLSTNPRLVVHLESGDDAVILRGRAREADDRAALVRADALYAAKYPNPDGDGFHLPTEPGGPDPVFVLRPSVALAWREHDFPTSATRFSFDR